MPDQRSATVVHVTTVAESLGFLTGQARFMAQRDIHVVAVISAPGPLLQQFAQREGIAAEPVSMVRRVAPVADAIAIVRLWRVMRRLRPMIVHSHTPKAGLLGTIASWLAGVPIRIYHMRGLPMLTASGTTRRLLRLSERTACRLATRVISVSDSVRQEAIDNGLCAPTKIVVLGAGSGQGVDVEARFSPSLLTGHGDSVRQRFGMPADALVVGFVGRLVHDKGVRELVEAWAMLRQAYPTCHLLMLGAGDSRDTVDDETIQSFIRDPRVHLVGHDWETPPYYAAMDVVAVPTYREGFPNVVLEASAMALPVVASRVTGCVDAVADGSTGALVSARDARALAEAIARYLENPALRQRHGENGRRRVREHFSREAVWTNLASEYERLVASHRG